MDEELYEVDLMLPDRTVIAGTFVVDDTREQATLTLRLADRTLVATADDYFDAMAAIRRDLERDRITLRCYGASKNVFPSGMSRDTGGGVQAYKLTLGHPTRMTDLVSIFERGPDLEPASVDEQAAFFQAWVDSLRTARR